MKPSNSSDAYSVLACFGLLLILLGAAVGVLASRPATERVTEPKFFAGECVRQQIGFFQICEGKVLAYTETRAAAEAHPEPYYKVRWACRGDLQEVWIAEHELFKCEAQQ